MGMHLSFIQPLSVGTGEFAISPKTIKYKAYSLKKINQRKTPRKNLFELKSLLGPGGGFFGVGSSEVLVIGAVAWLVLGPKRLYQLARDIGRISAEFKNVTDEARSTFQKAVELDTKSPEEKKMESNSAKNSVLPSKSKIASLDSIIDSEISTIKKDEQ